MSPPCLRSTLLPAGAHPLPPLLPLLASSPSPPVSFGELLRRVPLLHAGSSPSSASSSAQAPPRPAPPPRRVASAASPAGIHLPPPSLLVPSSTSSPSPPASYSGTD